MTRLAVSLVCLMSASCAHMQRRGGVGGDMPPARICGDQILVVVQDGTDDRIIDIVVGSIEEWNDTAGSRPLLYAGVAAVPIWLRKPSGFVVVREATPGEIDTWRSGTQGRFVRTMSGGCISGGTVLYRPEDPAVDAVHMRNVIAHEIGHALGVGHDRRGETLMAWQWPADVARLMELAPSAGVVEWVRKTYKEEKR